MTPEQAQAIENLRAAFLELWEIIKKAVEKIVEWIRETVKNILPVFDALLYAANTNPKWWHLYKHANKYRTRKKYRRLLVRQLLRDAGG